MEATLDRLAAFLCAPRGSAATCSDVYAPGCICHNPDGTTTPHAGDARLRAGAKVQAMGSEGDRAFLRTSTKNGDATQLRLLRFDSAARIAEMWTAELGRMPDAALSRWTADAGYVRATVGGISTEETRACIERYSYIQRSGPAPACADVISSDGYLRHDAGTTEGAWGATLHHRRSLQEHVGKVDGALRSGVSYPTQDMVCCGDLCMLRFAVRQAGQALASLNIYRLHRDSDGRAKVAETWFACVPPTCAVSWADRLVDKTAADERAGKLRVVPATPPPQSAKL